MELIWRDAFQCDEQRNDVWSNIRLECWVLGTSSIGIGLGNHGSGANGIWNLMSIALVQPGLDVVGDHTKGSAVVGLDWCGRLFVTHLFENLSHGDCLTGVDVEGA